MTNDGKEVWFPAKRYGWGWGLPRTWQGWGVICGYLALLWAGVVLLPPQHRLAPFLLYMLLLSLALVGICWLKGEKPRWRWGRD